MRSSEENRAHVMAIHVLECMLPFDRPRGSFGVRSEGRGIFGL